MASGLDHTELSYLFHFSTRFDNVVVFVIGGATYEESSFVSAINRRSSSTIAATGPSNGQRPNVLLCSNYIHNTRR